MQQLISALSITFVQQILGYKVDSKQIEILISREEHKETPTSLSVSPLLSPLVLPRTYPPARPPALRTRLNPPPNGYSTLATPYPATPPTPPPPPATHEHWPGCKPTTPRTPLSGYDFAAVAQKLTTPRNAANSMAELSLFKISPSDLPPPLSAALATASANSGPLPAQQRRARIRCLPATERNFTALPDIKDCPSLKQQPNSSFLATPISVSLLVSSQAPEIVYSSTNCPKDDEISLDHANSATTYAIPPSGLRFALSCEYPNRKAVFFWSSLTENPLQKELLLIMNSPAKRQMIGSVGCCPHGPDFCYQFPKILWICRHARKNLPLCPFAPSSVLPSFPEQPTPFSGYLADSSTSCSSWKPPTFSGTFWNYGCFLVFLDDQWTCEGRNESEIWMEEKEQSDERGHF